MSDTNDRTRPGDLPMDDTDFYTPTAEELAAEHEEEEAGPESAPRIRVVDDDAWRDLLLTKTVKKGDTETVVVLPNLPNAITILRYHPQWRGVLAYDAFAERIITTRPAPWHAAVAREVTEAGVVTETDTARVVDWFARSEGLAITPKVVEMAVPVVAEATELHPVRDYLRGLVWDGVERLPSWLSVFCGAKQSEYSAAVGVRWMISGVARVMEPGAQVDCVLVFEGPQGVGKSSAFRALVPHPSMHSETGVVIGDKDSYQCLHGIWVYVFDELDSLKRGDVTKTKNFLTSPKDHYRPSYGRVTRDFFRQNVFAGTTNETEYLVDRTGNRRFWPVRVVRPIDIAAIVRDRDQLWAEAYQRYINGERWYADTAELRTLCEAEQADRVQPDAWEQIVGRWLESPRERAAGDTLYATGAPYRINPDGVSTAEVLTIALGKSPERYTHADMMRVGVVLRALGYERHRTRSDGERGYRFRKAGPVGPEGGAGSILEEKAVEPAMALPALPETLTHTEQTGELVQRSPEANPGGAGRATEPDFADDLAELGIGGRS